MRLEKFKVFRLLVSRVNNMKPLAVANQHGCKTASLQELHEAERA